MRKFLSAVGVFALILITCLFFGCEDTEKKDDGNGEKVSVSEITNLAEYTIIRGDRAPEEIKKAVSELKKTIADKTGVELTLGTDYGASGKYEIIIGETKRSESVAASADFGSDFDYRIVLDGNKIIIIGANVDMTLEAVKVFTDSLLKDGKVYAPTGNGYAVIKTFPVEALSIEGKDISEYAIKYVSDNGSKSAKQNIEFATVVYDGIVNKVGKSLDMAERVAAGKRFITVDTTSLDYTKGEIRIEEGNVTLYGSFHSIDKVIDTFLDEMIGENKTVELKNGTTAVDTADLPDIYSKEDLMKVLQYSYDNNDILIVGDEINNTKQVPSKWLDIYKNGDGNKYVGTDTYPSLLGIDLGRCGFGLGFIKDHEWATVSQMVCEVVDYAAEGGIVTIASHFRNPSMPEQTYSDIGSSDRGILGDDQAWNDIITEGTALNAQFMMELERCARTLGALKDAGVPIIWRPMHEVDGKWFWWGTCSDTRYYVELWKYIYNYFTVDCGLDNLIWHYSPSITENCAAYYPGDEYVDIVGCDWYTGGELEILTRNHKPYEDLMALGKITNLAEVGISSSLKAEDYRDQEALFSAQSYFGMLTEMYREDYKIGFFATYNDIHSLAFLPGGEEFMKSEMVLDLSEMLPLFEEVAGFKPSK